jgi:hypothetical protein
MPHSQSPKPQTLVTPEISHHRRWGDFSWRRFDGQYKKNYGSMKNTTGRSTMMKTKVKLSMSIDKKLFALIERASQARKIPKSRLAEQAFALWFQLETEKLMAQGYEDMAAEDRAFAHQAFDAQKETVSD